MTLDSYEQGLLIELRHDVAARTPHHSSRRRWAWAVVPVVGAGIAAAVLTLTSPPAAFAVVAADNGDVVVTIHDLADADALTQALAAEDVQAAVRHVASFSQADGRSRTAPGSSGEGCDIRLTKVDGDLRFTLGAAQIAAGAELEIITSGSSPTDVGSPVAVYWTGGSC